MMKELEAYIRQNGPIQEISRLARGRDIYLVGGTVRDILMGRDPRDYDFSVRGSGIEFARHAARQMQAAFVVLDEGADEARVVKEGVVYDFIGLPDGVVVPDLLRRDFTVNAMAVNLVDFDFFDPCDGLHDLEKGVIRPTSLDALIADPLRVLRGFRFVLDLGFKLHRDFGRLARNIGLQNIAAERIGTELMQIVSHARTFDVILEMNQLGLFEQLFPEAVKLIKDFDLWTHSLNTYGAVEHLIEHGFFKGIEPEFSRYFAEPNRAALCKLAGLFHDVAKPDTLLIKEGEVHFYGHDSIGARMIERIAHQRLRFSRPDTDVLKRLVKEHMRLHLLATNPELSDRAIRRFFRHLGVDWFGAMMIAWADGFATGGKTRHLERAFVRMIDLYRADAAKPKVERLINGHDLIALGMEPGPAFKLILQELLDLQLEGQIKDKAEALEAARRIAGQITI